MAVDLLVLAPLTAKLIGVGASALKASDSSGWTNEDSAIFQKALGTVPGFANVLKSRAAAPFSTYVELVSVAFGAAWRRHWANNELLAPDLGGKLTWFEPNVKGRRRKQVTERLKQGTFATSLPGDGNAELELDLISYCESALASPWYKSLFNSFRKPNEGVDETLMPLLILKNDGEDRREFERHFRLAFQEGLTTERGRPVVTWIQSQQEEKNHLVRELLAAKLSSFQDEHVFRESGENSGLPNMPLRGHYVEPDGSLVDFPPSKKREEFWIRKPILGLLEEELSRSRTRIIVVAADFGRGKSLTARTIAYRYGELFLTRVDETSPNLVFPIFVQCQESLIKGKLTADSAVRAGQKRLAESFLPFADSSDDVFGLPRRQECLVLLDGLDEVQLSKEETCDFFFDLQNCANRRCRFIVFSRPASIPKEVLERQEVTYVELHDLSVPSLDGNGRPGQVSQVERWLKNWALASGAPTPTTDELAKRSLLELCAIPVLLFMIARTWETVRHNTDTSQAQVYDAFIRLTVRSKLEDVQNHHPVVRVAAEKLYERLITDGQLKKGDAPEEGLIELLSRIAWQAHQLRQQGKPQVLTVVDIRDLVEELGLGDDNLNLVTTGVLLTMSVSLTTAAREVHFAHESFREFLVGKYWEKRLQRIVATSSSNERQQIEEELYAAHLLRKGDKSYDFLVQLCAGWPDSEALIEWAEDTFNDESLSEGRREPSSVTSSRLSLREDKRYRLREAALAIGSAQPQSRLRVTSNSTLSSLLASFQVKDQGAIIVAKGLTASLSRLQGADLQGANLREADLQGANLQGANLREANLQGANLREANLRGADLQGANMQGANMQDANLRSAVLRGANLSRTKLNSACLANVDALGSHLCQAQLIGSHLEHANFRNSDFRRADLSRAFLASVDLSNSNLTSAILCDADLQYAKLVCTTLAKVDLRGANMQNALLRRAVLQDSNIREGDLRDAILRGANLQAASLQHTVLSRANLQYANFENANLSNANLHYAEGVTQPQLNVACGNASTQLPEGLTIPACPEEPPN